MLIRTAHLTLPALCGTGHGAGVSAVQLLPGKQLISASLDASVRIWPIDKSQGDSLVSEFLYTREDPTVRDL